MTLRSLVLTLLIALVCALQLVPGVGVWDARAAYVHPAIHCTHDHPCTRDIAVAECQSGYAYVNAYLPKRGGTPPYYPRAYGTGACSTVNVNGTVDYVNYAERGTDNEGPGAPSYFFPHGAKFTYKAEKNLGSDGCDAKASCGNPINVGIGNKYQEEVDVPLIGLLGFVRYYNSYGIARSTPVGAHWTNNYARSVTYVVSGNLQEATVARPEGDSIQFSFVDGTWKADGDVVAKLERLYDTQGVATGWKFQSEDSRESEYYDARGRLIEIIRANGNAVTLIYNNGQTQNNSKDFLLTSVTDQSGRTLGLKYNSTAQLVTVAAPDGAEIAYGYGSVNRLGTVLASGQLLARRYVYNESTNTSGANLPYALTGIFGEDGQRFATYRYATDGRAISTEHSGGAQKFTVVYQSNGTAVVTLPDGAVQTRTFVVPFGVKKTSSEHEACGGCVSRDTSYTFDAYGRYDVVTDAAGTTTNYDRDTRGLIVQQVDSANKPNTRRTMRMDWHPDFRVPVERRDYDAADVLVGKHDWTYNARGQVLTDTRTDPVNGNTRSSSYAYCEQADVDAGTCPIVGLLLAVDGPRTDVSDVVHSVYYPADDVTCTTAPTTCPYRKGDLWKTIDALGQVTEFLRYDGAGRLLSQIDANGVVTDFEYSPRGWLTARKLRGSDDVVETDDAITRVEYLPTGLVSRITTPDGVATDFGYDAAHRLVNIADQAGNHIAYTLDGAGHRVKEDVLDGSGVLSATLSRIYDQFGQLATQADSHANPTDYVYDALGAQAGSVDALGRATMLENDALGRLIASTRDLGGIEAHSSFAYDSRDRLTQVTDPKGLATHYGYDGLDNLLQLQSPDTGTTAYAYDAAGNRVSSLDARGEQAVYGYDAANRPTTIAYGDATLDVAFQYDAVPAACATEGSFSAGRLSGFSDGSGGTQYCYDRRGYLSRKVQTTHGLALPVHYTRDLAGRVLAIDYPSGTHVGYARDARGRVSGISVTPAGGASQSLLNAVGYASFGPATQLEYGDGRKLYRTVDQDYRPVRVEDAGADGLSLGYQFDAVGNITQLTNGDGSAILARYGYDALDRLDDVMDGPTGVSIETYTYDATGNRLSVVNAGGTTTYTYPANSHRLASVGGIARTYDAAGNTSQAGGDAYAYNAANRLGGVSRAGSPVATYAYNAKGERVWWQDSAETYAVYDESGHLLATYDALGALRQEFVWLDDLPVGIVAGSSAGAALLYVEPDHLGTPRVVIDPVRQKAVWTRAAEGEAFGVSAPSEDPDADGVPFVLDLRFPGQRHDAASGLDYNYFRDYDALIGRYAQSDPIGLAGGANTYAYASGNAVGAIDPFGLRDVVVAIWLQRPVAREVGHVFVGEVNGAVLLSQFPRTHRYNDTNMTYSWSATREKEGRDPDAIYRVHVPNDGAFDKAVQDMRDRAQWDWWPNGSGETNCAYAADKALQAGGSPGVLGRAVLPRDLNNALQWYGFWGADITRLSRVPW